MTDQTEKDTLSINDYGTLRDLWDAGSESAFKRFLAWHEARVAAARAEALREAADALDHEVEALRRVKRPDETLLSYINCTVIDVQTLRNRAKDIEDECSIRPGDQTGDDA